MRLPPVLVPLLVLSACIAEADRRPPPSGRFYFPTGLQHVEGAAGGEGTLFVASSNIDKRYDTGTLHAIDLDAIGLPAFQPLPLPPDWLVTPGPQEITELGLDPERNEVRIRSFAGEVDSYLLPNGSRRVFVPARSEGSYLNIVDAAGANLDCFSGSRSCVDSGPSLESHAAGKDAPFPDLPRALQPVGVTVGTAAPFLGRVFVTHLMAADSPEGSFEDRMSYLVNLDANDPLAMDASNYLAIAPGGADDVVLGKRFAYVSGRERADEDVVLRVVDVERGLVTLPRFQAIVPAGEGRGIAMNAAETRLYMAGRSADVTESFSSLLVFELRNTTTDAPVVSLLRSVPMPSELNAVKVIERPGRGELVVATASGAKSLVIYDSEVGQIVNVLEGIGTQPFGLSVSPRGAGARLFVSIFGDGQVAVIDIPDLAQPTVVKRVAVLGVMQ